MRSASIIGVRSFLRSSTAPRSATADRRSGEGHAGSLPERRSCLGYVDMVMTALGAGVRSGARNAACSTIGSTGVHMRAKAVADVQLNREGTGYVIALPIPGIVTQVQTNMGATINIDWILEIAAYLMAEAGKTASHADLIARIDGWFAESRPGSVLYHPYISEAGERGPFVNANARAGFTGLSTAARVPGPAAQRGRGTGTCDTRLLRGDGCNARRAADHRRRHALGRPAPFALGCRQRTDPAVAPR
jgi:hypothetical protein